MTWEEFIIDTAKGGIIYHQLLLMLLDRGLSMIHADGFIQELMENKKIKMVQNYHGSKERVILSTQNN